MKATGSSSDGRSRPTDGADCGWVRDLLPLRGSDRLDHERSAVVEEHLTVCDECRAEAALVARLRELMPSPPHDLVASVMARYAEQRENRSTGRWRGWTSMPLGLSAAAVAVAALGIGILWRPGAGPDSIWDVALDPETPAWYGEEWIVAGGPVPEALSDDVLLLLLEELEQ